MDRVLLIAVALFVGGLAGTLSEQFLHEVSVKEHGVAGGKMGNTARFGLGTKPPRSYAEQPGHRPKGQQKGSGRFHDPIKPQNGPFFPLGFR